MKYIRCANKMRNGLGQVRAHDFKLENPVQAKPV